MKKLKLVLATLAIALIHRYGYAADASYFSKFVAPGQTYVSPTTVETEVGTTTYRQDGAAAIDASTNVIRGPVKIMSTNSQRIGFTVTNISTRTFNNPFGDIRIYVGTSPVTTGFSSTTINQELASLAFSSNAYPNPLPGTWVLGTYSTTPYIDANSGNMTQLGIQGTNATVGSTNTVINPNYVGTDVPGVFKVERNALYQLPSFLMTYVGDLYAVAVGTFGALANSRAGRVRVTEYLP